MFLNFWSKNVVYFYQKLYFYRDRDKEVHKTKLTFVHNISLDVAYYIGG